MTVPATAILATALVLVTPAKVVETEKSPGAGRFSTVVSSALS